MSTNPDLMLDRRRLQRRVSFWRVLAFLIAIIAVIGIGATATRDQLGSQIARVEVKGVITDDWRMQQLLRRLGENDRIKAVILAIDSPGGTTAGGEALYSVIRELGEEKPVVASISTLGTSAAYLAALGTERIFVRETSITGSIGVIFQWANLQEVAETIGVDVRTIKSDRLKAEPSPFSEETPEARAVINELITDTDQWFERIFAERRDLSPAEAANLADGRIFSGARALDLAMADEIGGEREARAWLIANRAIPENAKIRTWSPDDALGNFGPAARLVRSIAEGLGLTKTLERFETWLPLDGLISLWHPQISER